MAKNKGNGIQVGRCDVMLCYVVEWRGDRPIGPSHDRRAYLMKPLPMLVVLSAACSTSTFRVVPPIYYDTHHGGEGKKNLKKWGGGGGARRNETVNKYRFAFA